MEDYLILEIPTFKPEYKRWKRYGYQNTKEKGNLQEVLRKSSKGFCMYCYTRIYLQGRLYGHLEHAIEKNNSEQLIECIPDIGIACPVCNESLKKIGEKKRKLSKQQIEEFEEKSNCSKGKRKQCTVPCKALKKLQKAYHDNEDAKIILQPMGVKGKNNKENLKVQYDVLKSQFQPAVATHTYEKEDYEFIEEHIARFRLNDVQYQPCKLIDFVKNVIDSNGIIPIYEYNNLVVELFAEKLKYKNTEEILKICGTIYLAGFLSA